MHTIGERLFVRGVCDVVYGQDWYQILQKIYTSMLWQSQKTEELEKNMEKIRHEMLLLKEHKQPLIDTIEYHFDQLKVEKLEGSGFVDQ